MILSRIHRATIASICLALAGCSMWKKTDLENAASSLDQVEKDVEEWGSVSASGLVLLDAKKQFAMDFDQKAEHYVERARGGFQASAATFTESVLRSQLAIEGKLEAVPDPAIAVPPIAEPPVTDPPGPPPTAPLAARRRLRSTMESVDDARAPGDLLEAMASGDAEGEPPPEAEPPADLSTQDPAPSAGGATEDAAAATGDVDSGGQGSGLIQGRPGVLSTLNAERFADPFSLSRDPNAISEGDAVKIGLSQKLSESLLKFLAHPEGIPENKRAFFGVFTLNCIPGWRTRKEYTGEISVRFEYAMDRHGWESLGVQRRLDKVGDVLRRESVTRGAPVDAASKQLSWLAKADEDLGDLISIQPLESARLGQVEADLAALEKYAQQRTSPLERACEEARAALDRYRSARRRDAVISQRDLAPDARELELEARAKEACERAMEEKRERSQRLSKRQLDEIRHRFARVYTFVAEVEEHFAGEQYLRSSSPLGKRMHDGAQQPEVISVLPFVESQTMDLRAGERWQTELGLQLGLALAAAGREVEAEQISEYVRRQQFDVESRGVVPIITSFVDGSVFGVRFRPAFTAMEDPSEADSDAAFVLHPTTTPCVVLLVADKAATAVWKYATWEVNERWLPIETHTWAERVFVDWWLDGHVFESFTNRERLARATAIDEAGESLDRVRGTATRTTIQFNEIERRLAHVSSYGAGRTDYAILPGWPRKTLSKPAAPTVTGVIPDRLWINTPTLVHVTGKNFTHGGKSIVKSVTVAGQTCEFSVTSNGSLYALVPKWSDRPPMSGDTTGLVSVATVVGVNTPSPLSQVQIDRWRNTSADLTQRLDRLVQAEWNGKVYTVRLPPGAPVTIERVLRAIERAVDADTRCCPQTVGCGVIPCVCLPCACPTGSHVDSPKVGAAGLMSR